MRRLQPEWLTKLRNPPIAWAVTLAILAVVSYADTIVEPRVGISLLYFVPITFGAWAIGRPAALLSALVAEVGTSVDRIALLRMGLETVPIAIAITVMRLLIYLFVAEVTFRLAQSIRDVQQTAEELSRVNLQLQLANERFESDIAAASVLQRSVQNRSLPRVEDWDLGMRVYYAGPIGGDYAEVSFSDGRLRACVADISGKGVPAALFTALLQFILRDGQDRLLRDDRLVAYMNSSLYGILPPETFVTLLYIDIDPRRGEVIYVNAGHPDGLLRRAESGEIESLRATSPLLAVTEGSDNYTSKTCSVNPGDCLLLYTDGATDSRRSDGKPLGDNPIRALFEQFRHLSAQEAADSIVAAIDREVTGGIRDDLAVICIKRQA